MTIPNFNLLIKKYADIVTSIGANIQYGQDVIIYAELDQIPLVHAIEDAAYARGANQVHVEWKDVYTQRQFLQHASQTTLTDMPSWLTLYSEELMAKTTTRISIVSADPDGLADVDANRIAMYQQAYGRATKAIREATMNNDISWLVIAGASPAWAQKVFPKLDAKTATDKLWEEIFKITRISTENDAHAEWEAHIKQLQEKANWLNQHNFKALHYTSSLTDLTIGLAEDHVWEAADSVDKSGNIFVANMPTEEVFTSPDARHISGHVKSTKPLSYSGVLITDIELTFKDGKITDAHAATGEETLQQLIATDAGSRSLGEVSLVPDPSPISQSGITFYTTLIDENASDHLAIGAAYPSNIKNGTKLDEAARIAKGQNQSLVHVDFMIGSADMNIDGITYDDQTIPVFRNGDWA